MVKPPKPPKLPDAPQFRIKTSKPSFTIGSGTKNATVRVGDKNGSGKIKPAFQKPKPVHFSAAKELIIQYFEDHPEILKKDYNTKMEASIKIYKIIIDSIPVRRMFSQIEDFDLLAAHIRNLIENALGLARRQTDT